jgi:hypothetical protein
MQALVPKKKYGKYNKTPKLKAHQLENLTGVLNFIQKEEGLKYVETCK